MNKAELDADLDAELVALNTCAKHLSYLDDKAIKRVLGYLADKFEIDREEICLTNEPLNVLF